MEPGALQSQSVPAHVGFSGLTPSYTLLHRSQGSGRHKHLPKGTKAPQRQGRAGGMPCLTSGPRQSRILTDRESGKRGEARATL